MNRERWSRLEALPDDEPLVPKRVGPYRIERPIGEGGVGTVYLARRDDGEFDQQVALKLVRRGLHLDSRIIRRFREERQILAALNHPGIARLFDGGLTEDHLPFFAMELVEGVPIDRYCEAHTLSVDQRLDLFARVCDAVAHAHGKQIVHCDIKPSNILVTEIGEPRLLDFGIAKLLASAEGSADVTRPSERLLTPEYASPEQIRGEPVVIASDVYSLGVLLYELLTGQRPFRRANRNVHELERAVLEEDPMQPSETVRGDPRHRQLKGDLDAIILTAMHKEPARRYASAAELAADVRRHLAGDPVTARGVTAVYRVRRWVRRHQFVLGSAIGGGVLAAGVLFAVAMSADRLTPGDRVLRTLRLSSPQHVTNDEGLELDPAISPDGQRIAYAAGHDGAMRIFVRQRDGSRAVAVSGSLAGDHRRPRWSPTGTQLLFQAERGIWLVPALGGAPRLVVQPPPNESAGPAHSAAWAPDGQQIGWVVRDTVYVRPLDGNQPRAVATFFVSHSLAWSPDGRWIAVVSGNAEFVYNFVGNLGPSALYLVPTRCERARSCAPVLVEHPSSLNTSPEWLDASRLLFVSNRGGTRDLFAVHVSPTGDTDEPVRLSAGQQIHTVSAAADGRTLAYTVFRQTTNIWSLDISSGRPRALTDATRITSGQQTIEGVDLSLDGQWLAFDANRAGQQDIYVVPASGGEPERVTDTPQDDFHPAWSPDGKSLAFYTFRDGVRRAATVSVRGGPIRLVHPTGPVREEHTPVWTRDGQRLIYWRNFSYGTELYEVRRTSDSTWSDERQLTRRGGVAVSFSADGSRMTYIGVAPGYVRLMGRNLDEASSRLVHAPPAPGTGGVRVHSGNISRDGATYIAKGEDAVGPGFWGIPIAGGAPRLLVRLDDPRRTAPRPEFATDGRRIFFTLTERDADVWAVRLDDR